MQMIKLPSGDEVLALGMGTWHMGEIPSFRQEEIAALRLGLKLGVTLIDTAEMYGFGKTEELVGEAITGHRDQVFLISKVMPQHATFDGTISACEGSLRRLGTDRIDLYMLHWRESVPLEVTLAAFEELVQQGKIRSWGVSNFDVPDMEELATLPGGKAVQTDQVLYNLMRRGIEYDLLPWCRERDVPIMAYMPIEQGRMLTNGTLIDVAIRHDATPAQVALAWVIRHGDVIVIPTEGKREHIEQDRAALSLQLTAEDLNMLDATFPPPLGKRPLEVF
ncbi:aldo/keto reductase [Streptosporangium sp. NPDC000396]|uniref:aldo/keto reductase n=1 Tax=Streptosporangium sp. NPDC000396 TaxID=3366185 RepID=UPI0036A7EBF8